MKIQTLKKLPEKVYQELGYDWCINQDTAPYLTDKIIEITQAEADAYYEAAETLMGLLQEAIPEQLTEAFLEKIGIPENIWDLVIHSWEDERHQFIYGRFDLAGGIDGFPIKLIEFNADTATFLPETAIIQWAQLKANGLNENKQFNIVFDSLVVRFKELLKRNRDKNPAILFTCLPGYPEDYSNCELLMEAAEEAGFMAVFEYIDNIIFSDDAEEGGVYRRNPLTQEYEQYPFLFKLIPWEWFCWDEPEILKIITDLVKTNDLIVVNPAYSLMYQSKALMVEAWEKFRLDERSDYLLATSLEQLPDKHQVKKPIFGREGANVTIISEMGAVEEKTDGIYGEQKMVYQEYAYFPTDGEGYQYQTGVFYAEEPAGLAFRRSKGIIDNLAQVVGHTVR